MIQIKDKNFAITGATSEIGRALALNLSRNGADVALIDLHKDKAQRIIDEINDSREIKEEFGKAAFIETDLTKVENAKEAMSKATEIFGGIDVLVCNLMESKNSPIQSPEYISNFERLVDVNTKSAVYSTHAMIPFMKGRKKGKIIFVISDTIRLGVDGESLDAVTRGGLIYYARSLARELALFNITVNCVSIGPIEEKLSNALPTGRILRADEIANAIAFLSSAQADTVTGQTWAINGGLTMF